MHTTTENQGSTKSFHSTPLATPRRALSNLSNNVTTIPWQSDTKHQVSMQTASASSWLHKNMLLL